MSRPVIEVENLGIYFKIFHQKGLPFKDAFISYGKDLMRRAVHPSMAFSSSGLFWAIRNASFSVEKGETIGIVGENGSGKSTLLKAIAGIFRPDEGRVHVSGKIGTLIELGAGFHPDLTGRENIYLNGSILGMKRKEIARIFDSIVGYSELEQFIDMPIKSYSSGMKVRLGFSVAIHLNPDVLLIDEVLAVGDLYFQAKCMETMSQIIKRGVTILFVSHDISRVRSICSRGIYLENGQIRDIGSAEQVTLTYFKQSTVREQHINPHEGQMVHEDQLDKADKILNSRYGVLFVRNQDFQKRVSLGRIQNGRAQFANIQLLSEQGEEIASVAYGQTVILRMAIEILDNIDELSFAYSIRDNKGIQLVTSDSLLEESNFKSVHKGDRYIVDWKYTCTLSGGNYSIQCVLSIPVDINLPKFLFCDFVPLGVIFNMKLREKYRIIGGGLHWDNRIEIVKIT
jgi:lipopolysaccharide transport system ATP-binding protein